MGTENTASTILQSAQLTSDANKSLQLAITNGFNMLGQSMKDASQIYQGMVKSTLDAKQIEIDEWYKTKSLELRGKELDIQRDHYEADANYKKAYLDAQKTRSAREASRAPLVSAIGKEVSVLDTDEKDVNSQLKILEAKTNGFLIDDKGKIVPTGTLPIKKGTPEFDAIQSQINGLKQKKSQISERRNKITSAVTAINLDGDPEQVRMDLYPDVQQNPFKARQPKEGPNPLLPGVDQVDSPASPDFQWDVDRMNQGSIPNENYPSYDLNQVDFVGPPISAKPTQSQNQEIFGSPKPSFYSRSDYDSFIDLYKRNSEDKQPLPFHLFKEMLSGLNPKDQEQINKDVTDTVKGYAMSIGEILSKELTSDRSQKDEIGIIDNTYRTQMTDLGFDPNGLNIAASKVRQAAIRFKVTDEAYRKEEDNSKKASLLNNYIYSNIDSILGIQKPEQKVTKDVLGIPVVDSDKFTSTFDTGPDGAPLFKTPDEVDLKTQLAVKTQKDFANKFLNKQEGGLSRVGENQSKFPVNEAYLDWIKGFKTPQDFNIVDYDIIGEEGYGSIIKKKPKEQVDKMVNQKIREIVNDPQKAYYFWLSKQKDVSTDVVPGFAEYKKLITKDLLSQ